jgi:hypothetical protein
MTKVATIDMRRFVHLVVIAAMVIATLLAALMPTVALAGDTNDTDQMTGRFTLGNSAPQITSVDLFGSDNSSNPTSMDPQVEYIVKVGVTDINGLSDLDTCNVTIFYDVDGDSIDNLGSDNYSDRVTLHHTEGALWTITPSDSTWSIPIGSEEVTLTGNTFVFCFHFKPGECARESANWNIVARVQDADGASHELYDGADYAMDFYGRIVMVDTLVTWSNVTAGMEFNEGNSKSTDLSVKYIANGNYDRAVTASVDWTGKSLAISGAPNANEFSLMADDDVTYDGDTKVVTTNATNCIMGTGTQTDEVGNQVDTNTLYLALGSPFQNGVFEGIVYFHLRNA